MTLHRKRVWVLIYECIGFVLIIAFCWLREMTGMAEFLFGGPPNRGDWRDATLGTLLILLVWVVVFYFTYRLIKHLLYLEGFVRVCGWCRKLCYRGEWIPLEDYFERGFHVGTTHGICPECFEKAHADTAQFHQSAKSKAPASPEGSEPAKQAPGPSV
jgi:hypothetical protein